MSGWIKLHRSLKDWEWYNDKNALMLLIHLLVSVNYEDKKWKGELIKAGSMVFSWDTLSSEIDMTVQQCRTAMSKLEKCGEVTRKVTNKYQLVTLCKWDKLQLVNSELTAFATGEQQTNNRQITTTKEYKEIKEEKKIYRAFDHLKITVDEVEKIKQEYTTEQIDDMLDRIQNYAKNKQYKNLYLTLKNWLSREYPKQSTKEDRIKNLLNNF